MNVFDTDTYPRPEPLRGCFVCGVDLISAPVGRFADRRRFKKITGMDWQGSISLNLFKDLTSLGLETVYAPDRATFCLKCAVEYMEEFNRRLTAHKKVRAAKTEELTDARLEALAQGGE